MVASPDLQKCQQVGKMEHHRQLLVAGEMKLQAYKSAATVGHAATLVEALEGCYRLALQDLKDLAVQTSGKLDTPVKELALKVLLPRGSGSFLKLRS